MKMFEYMASGTPLISSDLPVLREVLSDGKNALLAPTDDIDAWCAQLDRLISQPEFAAQLAGCAHEEYLNEYNWLSRAQKILAAGVHA
jgi:glycosyltransferase involved in cell wall biosynthesis